jgi:hypothetical protein
LEDLGSENVVRLGARIARFLSDYPALFKMVLIKVNYAECERACMAARWRRCQLTRIKTRIRRAGSVNLWKRILFHDKVAQPR